MFTDLLAIKHGPKSQRHQDAIYARNQELMDILFDMLEAERNEELYCKEAIIGAHIRLDDPQCYPGYPSIARAPRGWTDVHGWFQNSL